MGWHGKCYNLNTHGDFISPGQLFLRQERPSYYQEERRTEMNAKNGMLYLKGAVISLCLVSICTMVPLLTLSV